MLTPLNLSVLVAGASMLIAGAVSGVKDYTSKAHDPYMVTLPMQREGGKIGQAFIVNGISNMPATWKAWIYAPDGTLLCKNDQGNSASYDNFDGEYSWFDYDTWVGASCGVVPPNSTFVAEREFRVNGQIMTQRIEATL